MSSASSGRALTDADVEAIAVAVAALQAPPKLALEVQEACALLGCSWGFWRTHVEPGIRVVRRGSKKFVPRSELERWLVENAEFVLPETGKGAPAVSKMPANRRVRATSGPRRGRAA